MSKGDYTAVLNPFSKEGKEIAREAPPFDSIPQEIVDSAVERVEKDSGPEVRVGFDKDEIRKEVFSFYLMCQSVASVSFPYSNETRQVTESTKNTVRYRLFDLFRTGHGDLCLDVIGRYFRIQELDEDYNLGSTSIPRRDVYKLRDLELEKDGIEEVNDEIIPQYVPKYAVRWMDLIPLIEHRTMDLTEQYIVDGWSLLTPKKLWSFFANYVKGEMEDYISELYDKFSDKGSPSDILKTVGEKISDKVPDEPDYKRYSGKTEGGKLRTESFPPCIKKGLNGVGSGNRNYGIVVLLTPFLSYARISPSGRTVNRVADFTDDISTIEEDVIPMVFEAAENCNPPLFRDQPQDKANVYYHMGFGMTTQPRLRDSGKSKWYRPPNCRKIKTEAPALCEPNDLCSEVKNPLTYYYRALSKGSKSGD